MRSKLVLAALTFLLTLPVYAQVAPAAKIGGLPLGVGVGFVDYDTDYYYPYIPYWTGRMEGVSAWANYSVWRGFGVAVEGTEILGGSPTPKDPLNSSATFYGGNLKEATAQAGVIYRYHQVFKVRPFVQALGGFGKVNFPDLNPLYVSESTPIYSFGGGLEYHIWNNFWVRGQYEYQIWDGYRSGSPFHPQGATGGVTYYLRGVHKRY
jgi:hypothetical protein